VAETLTHGYLEMLGTLSKYQEGIEYVSQKFNLPLLIQGLQIAGKVQSVYCILSLERAAQS
jgi:hypothetical protein